MKTQNKAIISCAIGAVLALVASQHQGELSTSEEGLKLITNYEGCRLSPYKCPAGIWTNGIGHTGGVDPNRVITLEEAANNLVHDVKIAEQCVNKSYKGSLSQGKFDSMVSFTMNTGCGSFKSSTFAKTGECSQLLRWVYIKIDGKYVKSKGLANRRQKEYELCVR